MKRLFLSLVLTGTLLSSCKDKANELASSVVTVRVSYPATFSETTAAGAGVTLTGATDGTVRTVLTAANGEAVFPEILPGTYHISVSKTLTGQEALELTGISGEVTLNALQNNVVVGNGQQTSFDLELQGSAVGGLVIKEVYYTGSKTPGGGTYFSDQFIELYNNATDTLYLDSLLIGDTYGVAGLINPTNVPTPFNTDKDHVYLNTLWRIPGTGKQWPLAPGRSIIIAQDGVNHKDAELNPASPVDLSDADWETYNERPDNRDADAPGVPNLEKLYYNGGFDWNLPVFGPGLVLFKAPYESLEHVAVPGAPAVTPARVKVPNSLIIDAFEGLKDGNSVSFKRVPAGLDAGFVFADDTYNHQSFRRKTAKIIHGRRVLQDSNNSTNDFEKLGSPTPRAFD